MPGEVISILQFTNSQVRGGIEEHILMLLRGFDRNRFRLHLVCPPKLADKVRADLPPDVELIPLYLERPTQLTAILRLIGILRRRHISILHSHAFISSMAASPIGWLCRVPVILETAHGPEAWRRGWKATCYVDRFVDWFVDHYIAVSEANARYLSEVKGFSPGKISVIQNGCELAHFDPSHPAPAGLRQRLGFGDRDPVLIVVGRLEPQKGHQVLLQALPTIREEFPSVRLVCVGEGSLQRRLERQVVDLGLQEAVRFVGFQSNVADWIALGDLTVLPSFYEGLPLIAVESLAAGRPVVATAVDGTPEVVIDGKTGLTVPPGAPAALADAVCRLLADSALRARLAAAGHKWALEQFSRERMVEATQDLYLTLWARQKPKLGELKVAQC